jgi:DNA end-binding protein Ku
MPASRAYWKGYLKLSFVSCPIALRSFSCSGDSFISMAIISRRKAGSFRSFGSEALQNATG